MLVISPRGDGGMGRYYGGSGVFDGISRKMFSSGIRKAISSGAKSAIAHKVADAVVNGAASATQKAAESAANEAIGAVTSSVKKLVTGQKRSPPPVELVVPIVLPKRKKKNIDNIIDGSGIVLD